MSYTWGYIKNSSLAKLDLNEEEANVQNLTNTFIYYANEVITQISSAVKPKYSFVKFEIYQNERTFWNYLVCKYKKLDPSFNYERDNIIEEPIEKTNTEILFWRDFNVNPKPIVGEPQKMPVDFISFGDDVCYELKNDELSYIFNDDRKIKVPLNDEDFEYYGYNNVTFKRKGTFYISYNARWFTFDLNIDSDIPITDVPDDILECIPSYIASQCYKIDDEVKASLFRNEYEMMVARIDNTNYKNTKTFTIGGGW